MSRKKVNLIGQRFGRLTVIKMAHPRGIGRNGNTHFVCRCDCGNLIIVRSDNLKLGHTTKCHDCSTNGTVSVYVKVGDLDAVI